MSDTDVDVKTNVIPIARNGSHDAYAHIVGNIPQMLGYVEGREIVALCGKKWVPALSPDGRTVCPECRSQAERLGTTAALRRLDELNSIGGFGDDAA